MAPAQAITALCATDTQGNSVMNSLLANAKQQFHVRGTTRNTESESANALVVVGGPKIQSKIWGHEKLADVLKGSWGPLLNTHSQVAVNPI